MTAITATITGSDRCEADGRFVRSSAPVLALCRALLAAGHDAQHPLHAYRGGTLAVKVRSIGEGARLEINSKGTGFKWPAAVRTRLAHSPIRIGGSCLAQPESRA